MPRILPAILAALLASLWLCECTDAAEPVLRVNCEAAHQRELVLAPLDAGPFELTAVYCQTLRSSAFGRSAPLVSPDAQSIAYYEGDKTLRIARLDVSGTWTDYEAQMGTFARFGSNSRAAPAIRWSGEFLWAANQEKTRGGFATSALQPVKADGQGALHSLPPLRHDAGPLDGLLWADHDGLAVAQFGTRGGYYRPEHDDKDPSFAIVDAQRGLVRETLRFSGIEALKNRNRGFSPGVFVRDAVATKLPDGRVLALLSVGQWVVWTEGEAPRILPDPYVDEFNNRMAIAPDGSRVLIGRLLRTKGGMCGRTGGCTPGEPVEDVLADLRDLATGQMLWSIRATVTSDYEFPTPAISPDGRYALVGLVPQGTRPVIALIAMQDGKIVQTLPAPGGDYVMGFARGGRTVWTYAYGVTALYDLQAGAR
jgi:hypothetical protein